MLRLSVPAYVALLGGFLACAAAAGGGLVNEEVKRTVDLTTHLAKITAEILLANEGDAAAHSFTVGLEAELAPHLAYIGAAPFPTHITQAERQLVVFQGNHYLYSPYLTRIQSSRVRLASKNVETYTKLGNPSKNDEMIEYGPFRDVAPFTQDVMKIHYENNTPFLTISSITRTIEVSHWGNIAVEETIDLRHTGADLKGPFSRYDYQRQSDSGISSIKSFKTILPASAQDVYYRDEIGNISTSHLQVLEDSVEVEVRPRFPLFGGWKTHYLIGYNLPSYEYLYALGDQYALKMRLLDHVYDDQVIDLLTVKIVLPEGTFTWTRLIVATKRNLVEQHIQDMVVHYTFNKILMLQEPLLVVGAFYILFFTVIIYDPAAEVRMKVASITEQVLTLVNKRLGLYRHMDEVVNRYKQSRDSGALNSGRKALETSHRALTNDINSLQVRLKAEGSDLAEKVAELQKLDGQVKDLACRSCQEAERLVVGKVKKEAYIENEKGLTGRRLELVSRIDGLLDAL
uniref:Dolichyl-diphosphooligosaccharide--protein glycosyltransferase subunit 1 n=1 Tax=Denticeps clupeoides TaxID=299321 RepID=A0AAY4D215_9TELE